MDAALSLWNAPAVAQAVATEQVGAVIRVGRIARGLTLVELGRLVGYSASTISRIETGRRKLTDITQLRLFASALDIRTAAFGLADDPRTAPIPTAAVGAAPAHGSMLAATVSETVHEGGDDAMRRRQALAGLLGITGAVLTPRPTASRSATRAEFAQLIAGVGDHPSALTEPRIAFQRVSAAQAIFRDCHYDQLAATLPRLISTLEAGVKETTSVATREQLSAAVAAAYSLASDLCGKLDDYGLVWVTAERFASTRVSGGSEGSPPASTSAAIGGPVGVAGRAGHHVRSGAVAEGCRSRSPGQGTARFHRTTRARDRAVPGEPRFQRWASGILRTRVLHDRGGSAQRSRGDPATDRHR